MMNVSMGVIENLHEGADILDSEKSAKTPSKRLMENGIFGTFPYYWGDAKVETVA